jgi:hypothetical protein
MRGWSRAGKSVGRGASQIVDPGPRVIVTVQYAPGKENGLIGRAITVCEPPTRFTVHCVPHAPI